MKPVITYFHGKGCGSCRSIQPIIDEVKDTLNLNLVDTYEDTILAKSFDVEYIPTLIIEDENGQHIFEGPKEIKEVIKKLIL